MTFNIPWRMGANIRDLAFYGERGAGSERAVASDKHTQIETLHSIGVQIIRFYAPHNRILADYGAERAFQHIGETLDLLRQFDMQAIVCLGDALMHSGYFFRGDIDFHTEPSNGQLNRQYWLTRQYKRHYEPFLRAIVQRFGTHNSVLIWELGNEHAVRPNDESLEAARASEQFLEFAYSMTQLIRSIDRNALVGSGLSNSRHVFYNENPAQMRDFAKRLYNIVDAVSIHEYEHDSEHNRIENDVTVAADLRKLLYIGEVGSNINSPQKPRDQYLSERISYWRGRGAFTVMPWSFDATGKSLSDALGVSKGQHDDYNDIVHVVSHNRGSTKPFIPQALFNAIERAELSSIESQPNATESNQLKYFQATTKLSIRVAPDRDASRIRKDGLRENWLYEGDIIQVDPNSRTEADGHIWWKHDCGWSAERPLGENTEKYLIPFDYDPSAMVIKMDCREVVFPILFRQLPVDADKISWLQYFGSTIFAERLARGDVDNMNPRSYAYAQGYHGGFDFGNAPNQNVTVKAGMTGKVKSIVRDAPHFIPHYVVVESGDYTVIYGHLSSVDENLTKDQVVDPDTTIGEIVAGGNQHLHLEVRQSSGLILNTLLFMEESVRDKAMGIKNPSMFKVPHDPTLWQDPLVQPEIVLGGDWDAPWPEPPEA